ncbi:MAG: hypothetical protein K1X72_27180 [Pyrinomonadaceae bacterium]|nr:hypothetical protein [Pyrinomonadaceae bacterium]
MKIFLAAISLLLFAFLLAGCGKSGEKKIYAGSVNEANIPRGSTYAKSQIEHKNVELTIESIGKIERNLSIKSQDGLKLGDCQQPIKFDWLEDEKKAYFSTCQRVGTGETRNLGFGSMKQDGQNITIELTIDDIYYTFRGTQKP